MSCHLPRQTNVCPLAENINLVGLDWQMRERDTTHNINESTGRSPLTVTVHTIPATSQYTSVRVRGLQTGGKAGRTRKSWFQKEERFYVFLLPLNELQCIFLHVFLQSPVRVTPRRDIFTLEGAESTPASNIHSKHATHKHTRTAASAVTEIWHEWATGATAVAAVAGLTVSERPARGKRRGREPREGRESTNTSSRGGE